MSETYSAHASYFYLLSFAIVGQTFIPVWFFHGVQRMLSLALCMLLSKVLYVVLTIAWVKGPEDYEWVAVANGFGLIAAAVTSLAIMIRMKVRPIWCGLDYVVDMARESAGFFWSRAAVATYTAGGTFMLGLMGNPTQVAYYSAAEQLYKGAQSMVTPVSQALYPYMAKQPDFSFFFKVLKLGIVASLLGALLGCLVGEQLLEVIFGNEFAGADAVLVVFMCTFAITTPSILIGYPFLGALGNAKAANRSVMWGGLVQLIFLAVCFVLSVDTAVIVGIGVVMAEVVVLLYRATVAKRTFITHTCVQKTIAQI